jgi:uncharacterized glyoxalase superfamily protein PhnB
MKWEAAVPHLPVRDVGAALEWYRDVLGVPINWLCSLFVDDVEAVNARCVEHAADIAAPLEEKPWNMREFTLRDPDGNLLRIGTSVEDPVLRPEISFPRTAS